MRKRATTLVIRHGKILLVRERGRREYSLPGGGIDKRKDVVVVDGEEHCSGCYNARWTGFPCKGPHKTRTFSRLAAIRELKEELGLTATDAKFLFHHQTPYNRHSVYLIRDAQGHCRIDHREISDSAWWDGVSSIRLSPSAKAIISRYRGKG